MSLAAISKKVRDVLGITPNDNRSLRLVAVIECLLNQNARDCGAATYPALNKEVLQLCMKYDIGILQIPCPEMRFMGLARTREPGQTIRERLDSTAGIQCCQEIGGGIADRIQEYVRNGNRLLAILGGNPESPGCAVNNEGESQGLMLLTPGSGVLMRALQTELRTRDLEIPFRGIRDYRPDLLKEDLVWLERRFCSLTLGPETYPAL